MIVVLTRYTNIEYSLITHVTSLFVLNLYARSSVLRHL